MNAIEGKGQYNRIKKKLFPHWQQVTLFLVLYDFVAIVSAYFIVLWIRFDCRYSTIPAEYINGYFHSILIYTCICILIFAVMRLYRSIWCFASFYELTCITQATVVCALAHLALITFFYERMPVSYYVFGIVIQYILTVGVRFSYRFILLLRGRNEGDAAYTKHVMIIGAGSTGQIILRDIKNAKEINEKVCCFIDDNPNKQGRYIDGIIVAGGRDDILAACEKYKIEKIYVAIPSASMTQRRDILNICKETQCELKNLPGMYQLMSGQVSIKKMRDVAIEDLLGRDPIRVDMREIYDHISGKVVLITGGGGSIGSELARQVAGHCPGQLILFDVYENNVYDIQLELKSKYPKLNLVVLIGSVRDSRRMFQIFEEYHPEIVYHAAAHKHVPLMEDSPCESIKNNVFGTYKTAYAAMANGCERFVLISTDKAVNPTNIMGASKRICEMVIQTFDQMIKAGRADQIPQLFTHDMKDFVERADVVERVKNSKTEFVAVRFGNVLGSNGSVIPIFKRQIEKGGPVTVTHPDIIRYFMTIPEAVSLVMQAGVYAKGGEIFVLDMGEPVKIDTLARNMIKLSGLKPGEDIRIEYVGLRPGEKLFEEKLMAEEGMEKTRNELIHIGHPIAFERDVFIKQLSELMCVAYKNKSGIRDKVREMVGTYDG